MFISPEAVLSILADYNYLIIFPIAVLEGPIIVVITGFLVYLGHLNPIVAYTVLVVADMIGDSFYYSIGRFAGRSTFVRKYGKYLGYDESKEALIEQHFKKHMGKTFLLAKISHGIGGTVQVAGGIARVNFLKFLWYSFLGTVPKVFILLMLGYYAGDYYIKIDEYFNRVASAVVVIVVLVILFYVFANKYSKEYFNKASK